MPKKFTADEKSQAVTLLENAAGRIDATGWTSGRSGPMEGPNCLSGAVRWEALRMGLIDQVYTHRRIPWLAWQALTSVVSHFEGVVKWNDHFCADGAMAARKLREAAKLISEEEEVIPVPGTYTFQ